MTRKMWMATMLCFALLSSMVIGAEPIRLGGMASLQEGFGKSIEAGVRLAVHELNAAGGIDGRPLEFTFLDSEHSPAIGRTITQRLIFNDKVQAIIGCHASPVVLAIADMMAPNKILHIGMGSAPALSELGLKNPWFNRMRENDLLTTKVVANYAIDTLGLDSFACLYQSDQFGIGGRDSLLDVLKEKNVPLLANEALNLQDRDFTSQLLKVKQSGAKAVLMIAGIPALPIMVKQARQLVPDVTIFTVAMGATKPFFDIAQEASEGIYSVCVYTSDNQAEIVQKFNKAYEALYGTPPLDFFAALGYDAVYTIRQAMLDAGTTTDQDKIRAAYRNIKGYHGVSGLEYNMSANGEIIHELIMITYENGKQKVVAVVKSGE